MRSLFLFAISFIFITGANAQKCSYITNTVSGMDGTRLVITQPEIFANGSEQGLIEVWAKLHLDSVIVLSIVLHEAHEITVIKGDSLVLADTDGGLVHLSVMQDVSNPSDDRKSVTIYAIVTNEVYHQVEDLQIASLEFKTSEGTLNLDSDYRKGRHSIPRVLGCVHAVLEDK